MKGKCLIKNNNKKNQGFIKEFVLDLLSLFLPHQKEKETKFTMTVCDPTMGTGMTGVAAAYYICKFVAIEKDTLVYKVKK